MDLNTEHIRFDPVMELLCCLSKTPVLLADLVHDMHFSKQREVDVLIEQAVKRGFSLYRGVEENKAGRFVSVCFWDWPRVRRECDSYWQAVNGNGEAS